MTDAGHPAPKRRLRPFHVIIVIVLIGVAGFFIYEWSHMAATAVGKGPPTEQNAPGTTRQEAEANSRGQGAQGSNSSDEAYTAQNQSRTPPSEPR